MFALAQKLLRSDRGENSIMQTITIAVSAILIAAGLVTAPGLINNARDNNATTDLANIAYSEEWALANYSRYFANVQPGETDSLFDQAKNQGDLNANGVKYTLSGKVTEQHALVCETPSWSYLIKAKSSSGKVFFRSSTSAVTSTSLSNLSISSCIIGLSGYAAFTADAT